MELFMFMKERNPKIFMNGESKMITQTQKDLIKLLKACGLDREAVVGIVALAKTDEKRDQLIQAIIDHYDETGAVTEEDILKLLLVIVGKRKQKDTNSTTET